MKADEYAGEPKISSVVASLELLGYQMWLVIQSCDMNQTI